MHRIERLYYETGGKCYLSFSGGKDSTIVLAVIKLCEEIGTIPKNAVPAVFCDTKIELDATVDFVHWVKDNWYSNVQFIKTEKSFAQVIKEYGVPFRSKLRSHQLYYYKTKPELKTAKSLYDEKYGYGKYRLANRDFHVLHSNFSIQISDKCCDVMKKNAILQIWKR